MKAKASSMHKYLRTISCYHWQLGNKIDSSCFQLPDSWVMRTWLLNKQEAFFAQSISEIMWESSDGEERRFQSQVLSCFRDSYAQTTDHNSTHPISPPLDNKAIMFKVESGRWGWAPWPLALKVRWHHKISHPTFMHSGPVVLRL